MIPRFRPEWQLVLIRDDRIDTLARADNQDAARALLIEHPQATLVYRPTPIPDDEFF